MNVSRIIQARQSSFQRTTKEVDVSVSINLDGTGRSEITTGLPFLDHMLAALAKHARFDLSLNARGDVHVDDHHTVEDCALALGQALDDALGDRSGIARFGFAFAPLDEALVRAVVDLSARPWPQVKLRFVRETIGTVATENLTHFLNSLCIQARFALHVNQICGENDHHKAEAAFKAVALALRAAVRLDGTGIPSTKGVL
ncbi:MAG: imidazoleglycerol phosphate dehydratase HisB [Planctomycetota bacterium]|jgi:imidazoleglycerol phosphate dehydratase HisB